MAIQRPTVENLLGDVPQSVKNEVSNLPLVRAVSVALDQVCNRVHQSMCSAGALDDDAMKANAGDLEYAMKQAATLRLAFTATKAMIDDVEQQLQSGNLSVPGVLAQYGIMKTPGPITPEDAIDNTEPPAAHAATDAPDDAEADQTDPSEPEPVIPAEGFPEDDAKAVTKRKGKKTESSAEGV